MSRKSSTFVRETREREEWLNSVRGAEAGVSAEQLLAMAALVRGTFAAIPEPDEAEERSRELAIAELRNLQASHGWSGRPPAPWYQELLRFLGWVFTLGRRR